MYLQSIKSVKHNAAKSDNRSILKKSRHLGFGVLVHSFDGKDPLFREYRRASLFCTESIKRKKKGKPMSLSQLPWGGGG